MGGLTGIQKAILIKKQAELVKEIQEARIEALVMKQSIKSKKK